MDPAVIGLVRVLFALAAGVICGLGPLIAGFRFRQRVVGVAGLCLCAVAGLAFGVLLALPLSILLTAGIAYWPAADSQGTATQLPRNDAGLAALIYSIVFGAAAIWCVVSWIVAMASGFEVSVLLFDDVSPRNPASNQGETLLVVWWLMRWGVGVMGLFANVLLMLRLRPAIFLGYLTAACEALALLAVSRIEFLSQSSGPDFWEDHSTQLNFVGRLAIRFAPLLIYAIVLVRFHKSSLPPPPANETQRQSAVPSWMSDTRMSTSEGE
jgi:hypothetical protein